MLSPCVQALIFTGGSSVGRAADCRASRDLLVPGSIPGRRKVFLLYIILYLNDLALFATKTAQFIEIGLVVIMPHLV